MNSKPKYLPIISWTGTTIGFLIYSLLPHTLSRGESLIPIHFAFFLVGFTSGAYGYLVLRKNNIHLASTFLFFTCLVFGISAPENILVVYLGATGAVIVFSTIAGFLTAFMSLFFIVPDFISRASSIGRNIMILSLFIHFSVSLVTRSLLPQHGPFQTTLILNFLALGLGATLYLKAIHPHWITIAVFLASVVISSLHYYSQRDDLVMEVKNKKPISFAKDSRNILLLAEMAGENPSYPGLPEHVLYLNGNVQFDSRVEQSRYACLVNIPIAAAESVNYSVKTALVLGGGNGLAARNLLTLPRIIKVKMVEPDGALVTLAKSHPKVRMYNLDSLRQERTEIVISEPFQWIRTETEKHDLIVIDFPSLTPVELPRLTSTEFYLKVARLLAPNGFLVVAGGSIHDPSDKSGETMHRALSTLRRSLESANLPASPYFATQTSTGFLLASRHPQFDMNAFVMKAGLIANKRTHHLCAFRAQWKEYPVIGRTINSLPCPRAFKFPITLGLTSERCLEKSDY